MAHEYTTWAYAQRIDQPLAKFVLVCLADAADASGRSFPGQRRLSEMTGMAVRTLRRHIEALEAQGYVQRTLRRRRNGTRTSDEYQLPHKDSSGQIGRLFTTGQTGRLLEAGTNADQNEADPSSSSGQIGRLSVPHSTGQIRQGHRPNWPVDTKRASDPSPTQSERVHQAAKLAGHEPLTISEPSPSPPTPSTEPAPATSQPGEAEAAGTEDLEGLTNTKPLQLLARRDKHATILLETVAKDAGWKYGQKTEAAQAILNDPTTALAALDKTFALLGGDNALKHPFAYFRKLLVTPEVATAPTPPRNTPDFAALIQAAKEGDTDALTHD